MSLIYSMIARGNDVVLVEHQTIQSNFPTIIRNMLPKLKRNTRLSYLYNQNHFFHYINDQDFTYLCLSDKVFPKRTAFAFLEDIKQVFCERFSLDVRLNSIPLGMMGSFEDNLKGKIIYYNSQPENEKIQRLQSNLNDVKDQMIENIDKILDREEQIQLLVQKSDNMNQYASNYKNTVNLILNYIIDKATAVRKDQEWRQMKMKIFIGCIVVGMIVVMLVIGY